MAQNGAGLDTAATVIEARSDDRLGGAIETSNTLPNQSPQLIKVVNGATPASLQAKPPAKSSTERSRECRKKKREAAAAALADAPIAATVASVATNMQRVAIGVLLILTAMLLAGIGMTATISYSLKTAVGADRFMLAALAAAADMLTLMLPTAASAVWRARRRGLALVGVLLWLAAAGITASNVAGFLGVNGDAFVSGRETAVAERTLVLERVARLRAERAAITEGRPVGVITVAIRNATKAKIDDDRAALAIAKRRDAIDAELAVIETTIPTLPPVNAVDPSGATISGIVHLISGVAIAAATLQRARFALLLALPLLGGVVLAIGAALIGERRAQ
jgi:hypothetical protein